MANPKGKLKLDDLETEMKALIIDQINRPSDLKNVCLVNKQFHEIALKPLYRNVSLDLGSSNDTRLSAFLNPHNKGLKHIRQLRLYLANVPDKCNQKQQANFATRMILEFLPEDVLEEFRWAYAWCPWEPFSTDNLLLLYKKQRRMKWLEVMDLDRHALPEIKKNPKMQKDIFAHTKKLALYPENTETMELSQFFVEKTADKVEELILHANFDSNEHDHSPLASNPIDPREINDSATQPGLLSRTIFSHLMPFEKCEPFKNLKSLRLHRISLRYCADTWCKFVDFTKITALRIYHCPGADSLLGQLSRATSLPKQLRVFELTHKDNSENETLIALDGFLCLVSGIRDLVIDMEHVKSLPAAAGIARHGKTLELLSVHCSQEVTTHVTTTRNSEDEELVWDTEEFEKICKACTLLEQLSCAWPQSSLIRSPSDDWKFFENAVVSNMKGLACLQISTYPNNKPSTQLLPRFVYEQLLQGLAQRVFENAGSGVAKNDPPPPPYPPPATAPSTNADGEPDSSTVRTPHCRLRLLAFGISDQIYEREESKNQMIFLKSTCKAADGNERVYAAPIGWCMRQFVEPASDILDFVLHRDTKVPCREDTTFGGPHGGWGDGDDFEIA